MAEANLTLPDGTVIVIKGSPEEIVKVVALYGGSNRATNATGPLVGGLSKVAKKRNIASKKRGGVTDYILDLKAEGFFNEKRTLAHVQKELEKNGHIYAQTSLSVPLLRLVKKRELGRMDEKGLWWYVKR